MDGLQPWMEVCEYVCSLWYVPVLVVVSLAFLVVETVATCYFPLELTIQSIGGDGVERRSLSDNSHCQCYVSALDSQGNPEVVVDTPLKLITKLKSLYTLFEWIQSAGDATFHQKTDV